MHIDTTESTIADVFKAHAPVERVKKIRDYAFVHFMTKEDARKAKASLNGKKIDGCAVEVGINVSFSKKFYDYYLHLVKMTGHRNINFS